MNIEKELAKRLINDGESVNRQESYSREINFYELVASGRTASLEDNLKDFGNVQKLGKLSSNELQNVKYHAVILAAMVSRFCIESGMEISVAYTLSDIYIELIDVATSINEVNDLQKDLLRAYCQRMNEQAKSKVVSPHSHDN